MLARKMPKVRFAVFFMVAALGAVLLLISQIPLTKEGYGVIETRSFSPGEPLTFYWTFEPNVRYRFVVDAADWTNQASYFHYFTVGILTYSYGVEGGFVENPSSWNWSSSEAAVTQTLNVSFWQYGSDQVDQAFESTLVEVAAFRETTYHLTYLIYVGLPLLIIGTILATISGKDLDSRMRMPDTSARFIVSIRLSRVKIIPYIRCHFYRNHLSLRIRRSSRAVIGE